MKKKILSTFLVLCMMVTMLPTLARAVEPHAHCVCGGSVSAGDHTSHTDVTYTALDNSFKGGLLTSGNYYLATDVTLTSSLTIASGQTVNLCLNGHKLDANGGAFVAIRNSGILKLCDCRQDDETAQEHWYYYDSEKVKYILSDSKPDGFDDMTVSKGSFHGGVITGSANKNGGGVYNSGTFQMYSGAIAGNNVSVYGGGVYNQGSLDNAVMYLYGGRISGNKAGDNAGGGGVFVSHQSTFTMYGGEISNNTTKASGGGVYVSVCVSGNNASFIMQGGIIRSNTARQGGGMSTNTVSGSTATFTMIGGEISDNTASLYGGGVYKKANTIFHLSGNIKITGNKVGTVDSDIYLQAGTIDINGVLTNQNPIGMNMSTKGVFTSGDLGSNNYADKFKSDDSNCMVAVSDTQLELKKKPTVSSVTVNPSFASVVKGQTQQFSATITGTNEPAQTVNWIVNSTDGSTIDDNGILTVAAEETAENLIVTATSTVDTSKFDEVTVTVVTPTYTIAATPLEDFGKVAVGYSTTPESQTITITNTGNQPVTLTQPTSTNYTISAFSSNTVEAGRTATFTVQPKSGLPVGIYNETITVCTGKGTSTTVSASFRVRMPLTGTVSIGGTQKYGEQLIASVSDDNNTGSLSYQWKRGSTDSGSGNTYIIKEADIGQIITCIVTSSIEAGSISASTSLITKADSSVAPNVSFSFDGANANRLMGATDLMEYSLNGGDSYTVCSADLDLTSQLESITAENDIRVRIKETATHHKGAVKTIDITEGTAVVGVSKANCTTATNDGKLVGVTAAMEYQLSSASSWTAGKGSDITSLPMGNYFVRNKATGTTLAGKESIFVIEITYDLIVNANGSSGASGDGRYTAGTEVAINAGTTSGYIFKGWTADNEGSFEDESSISTTFIMPATDSTITANWTARRSNNNDSGTTTKPTEPVTGYSNTGATMDSNGTANISVTDKTLTDAIESAQEQAEKKGVNPGEITAVIHVSIDDEDTNTVTVNLPKTTQQEVIKNKIANVKLVIDRPDLTIGMNLAAVTEINKQAKDDVQISATKTDSAKLGTVAKNAIGNRPAFNLKAIYNSGTKHVSDFGNGSVIVEIPYTLQKGENAGNIYAVYVDENGKVIYLANSRYDDARESLVFSTNHFSVYGVGYKSDAQRFSDITNHWAKEDIEFVAARGLMSGIGNDKFSPDTAMTRGMFVTALGRLTEANVGDYKKSRFSDVAEKAYYMPYVEWAAKHEIVKGIGNGSFAPDSLVTREQLATIMERYANVIALQLPRVNEEEVFADNMKISTWATTSVKNVQMAGIVSGKNNNLFDPLGTATRAEVSVVLKRFLELIIWNDTVTRMDNE